MIQVEGCFENIMLDVVVGESKPEVVVEDQIFAISTIPASEIYVSEKEPLSPASGDIWVMLGDSVCRLSLSDTFDVGLSAVRQYDGSEWIYLAAYVGRESKWELFGVPKFERVAADIPQSLDEVGYGNVTGWDYIVLLCNSGVDVRGYFCIGDTINIPLAYKDGSSETAVMAIGTFYRNNISNTNRKAPIGFTQTNLLATTTIATDASGNLLSSNLYNMEKTDTNINSWSGSMMCTDYMPIIFEAFPENLRAASAIKTVEVYTSSGNKSTALITSHEKVRIQSAVELGIAYCNSSTLYAVLGEGSTYEYYVNADNRKKTLNGTAANYWTRSPYTGDAASFLSISTTGAIATRQAQPSTRAAIALTFDI